MSSYFSPSCTTSCSAFLPPSHFQTSTHAVYVLSNHIHRNPVVNTTHSTSIRNATVTSRRAPPSPLLRALNTLHSRPTHPLDPLSPHLFYRSHNRNASPPTFPSPIPSTDHTELKRSTSSPPRTSPLPRSLTNSSPPPRSHTRLQIQIVTRTPKTPPQISC